MKRKIKWFKLIIFVVSVALVIHDTWLVFFSYWFTNKMVGFTWFGLITYFIAWSIIGAICVESEKDVNYLH